MSNKQKILFISPQPFFEWRGSSIRVKFNAMALANQGHDVTLLTLPIGADVPNLDVNVVRAWNLFGSKKIAIGPSLLKLWFDVVLLVQGAILIRRNSYTILHGTEEAGFICYLLSKLSNAKYIYEKHSDIASYKKGGLVKRIVLDLYARAERLTIKNADLVICTGPGLAELTLKEKLNDRVIVIPDIPSSLVESTEKENQQARNVVMKGSDEILISYVGSFAEYQGVDVIFDAIPQVIAENNKIKFMIIGGSDEEIIAYTEQLAAQGVADHVHFIKQIHPDELPAYLGASDILLAPRKSGINSPLKILDYFKADSAIVATNTVANKRLLNESNAVLCSFDAKDFAKNILELSKDANKRDAISSNAFALYNEKYNYETFQESIEEAYQSIAVSEVSNVANKKPWYMRARIAIATFFAVFIPCMIYLMVAAE